MLIALVRRIQRGEFATDTEVEAMVTEFASSVPHPDAQGLIFWPGNEFDHEPTAANIVDRALAYRAIAL